MSVHLAGMPYLVLSCVPFPETFIYSRSRTIDSIHTGAPRLSSGCRVHFLPLVTPGLGKALGRVRRTRLRRPEGLRESVGLPVALGVRVGSGPRQVAPSSPRV